MPCIGSWQLILEQNINERWLQYQADQLDVLSVAVKQDIDWCLCYLDMVSMPKKQDTMTKG